MIKPNKNNQLQISLLRGGLIDVDSVPVINRCSLYTISRRHPSSYLFYRWHCDKDAFVVFIDSRFDFAIEFGKLLRVRILGQLFWADIRSLAPSSRLITAINRFA